MRARNGAYRRDVRTPFRHCDALNGGPRARNNCCVRDISLPISFRTAISRLVAAHHVSVAMKKYPLVAR